MSEVNCTSSVCLLESESEVATCCTHSVAPVKRLMHITIPAIVSYLIEIYLNSGKILPQSRDYHFYHGLINPGHQKKTQVSQNIKDLGIELKMLVLLTLVIITCLLGDNFVQLTRHPLLRALCDNATHAVIGALSGITFVIHFYDRISNVTGWIMIFGCFVTSSFIDLDHFIEARSFSLEDATSITHRPFLHCSTIPVILFFTYIVTSCLNYFKTSLLLATLCIAFFTHHTRDALRRGFWFCPLGHTDRIPHLLYITMTVATPYLIYYTLTMCKSTFFQGFTSSKMYENSRPSTRYSIV